MVRRVAIWKWGVVAVVAAISAGARLAVGATTSQSLFELYPDCEDGERERIGDGVCDPVTNNLEACDYDGGDCCECDCVSNEYASSCLSFSCEDTASECYEEPGPSPAPVVPVEEEELEEDSAVPLSRPVTLAAIAAAACGGALAAALGW